MLISITTIPSPWDVIRFMRSLPCKYSFALATREPLDEISSRDPVNLIPGTYHATGLNKPSDMLEVYRRQSRNEKKKKSGMVMLLDQQALQKPTNARRKGMEMEYEVGIQHPGVDFGTSIRWRQV